MVLCVRGSMNLGLALACGPYSLTLIPEDWARQCNMGAARGLRLVAFLTDAISGSGFVDLTIGSIFFAYWLDILGGLSSGLVDSNSADSHFRNAGHVYFITAVHVASFNCMHKAYSLATFNWTIDLTGNVFNPYWPAWWFPRSLGSIGGLSRINVAALLTVPTISWSYSMACLWVSQAHSTCFLGGDARA